MSNPQIPIMLAPEYTRYIGQIAIGWSAVEYHVNMAIWEVANVPSGIGACLTAQIFTFDGRMKALVSLLNLKRFPSDIVKEANRFHEDSRGPLEVRNRVVHDYWVWDAEGTIHRLEMTASKKLKLEPVVIPIDELKRHDETIGKLVDRSAALKERIYAVLPTLPDIPDSELRPIRDRPKDP